MLKIFPSRAHSPVNIVWVMITVIFLGFHTLLFTHVNERLDKALKRVDKLEVLLINIIASDDQHTKDRAMAELRHIRNGLDSELSQTAGRTGLRSRRSNTPKSVTDFKSHDAKRISRVEKKVKKCLDRIRNISKRRKPRRFPRNEGDLRKTTQPTSPRPCCTKPREPTTAVFTIWGAQRCFRESSLVLRGQAVMVDGSDFLCLPDKNPDRHLYRKARRNLDSHMNIRGVTYGDIENVDNLENRWNPLVGGRNNKTVPCVVCARANKTSSVMLLASKEARMNGLNFPRAEYYGVLMSSKQSKQTICVITGATVYGGDKALAHPKIKETAQLHPAEIDCDSVRCSANRYYQNGKRMGCTIVTI